MNIKEKLIGQVKFLEKVQNRADGSAEYADAVNASKLIMDYIILYNELDDDDDFICEDCLERELHEQMVDDIAKASDLPPELVQRVLDGQAEVFGMDD